MTYRHLYTADFDNAGKPFLRPATMADVRESTVLAQHECSIIDTMQLAFLRDSFEKLDKSSSRKRSSE